MYVFDEAKTNAVYFDVCCVLWVLSFGYVNKAF